MTDAEFDKLLRAALIQAQLERWEAVMDGPEEPWWSPAQRRRMDRILKDPFGEARRRSRPLWKKALRAAACFLLAVTVAFGGIMAIPSARAWVLRMFREQTPYSDTFRFTGECIGELEVLWRLGYVPEGYEEAETQSSPGGGRVTYQNSAEDRITLDFRLVQGGNSYNLDNEHSTYAEITFAGGPAHLYTTTEEGWPSTLIWFSEDGTIAFQLSTRESIDELFKMAMSVYSDS